MASLSPPSHFVRNPHLNWHDSPNPFHIVCLDHSEQSYYTSHALNAKFENQLQTEFIRGARLRVCQSGLKSNAVTQPMWGQECLVMLLAFTISLFTVICQLSLCGLKPSLDKHKDRKAHENLQWYNVPDHTTRCLILCSMRLHCVRKTLTPRRMH